MDPVRRSNLIAFMARLTALGVCDGALSSIVIQMFKVAFEAKRPPLDEDATSNLEPLALLVPECLLWIRFCGYKLLALATKHHSFGHIKHKSYEEWTPGSLARSAGVEYQCFSLER
jgi:hypothetical protein